MSYNSLKSLTPAQALVLYYGVAILAGALLLCTPLAAVGPHLSFLDALFTATSAQCVTGLSVVDTGTRLSGFGQGVVLALIQVGGLGITTFSVYLFIYLRVGVSIRGRWIINETLLPTPVSSWRDLIRSIFLTTLIIETLGALLLSFVFVPDLGLKQGIYSAVFHSISAFCNAGFSLFPDSLIGYRNNPLVNVTIMALIILGGIGFLVIRELADACKPRQNPLQPRRFSLHTKLVILTTVFLIIYGAVTIGWLERHDALAHMSTGEAAWTALFQSVSARTAGFNTIDLDLLRVPTLFLMIFLMFIGASPGSAGGGVKTTCLALLFILFYNRLKGNPNTNAFGRTIPEDVISRALSLFLLAMIVIGLALFGLLIAQSPDWAHENPREFLGFMFETVSAFGTVGLSMGSTGQLNIASKCIVIALMFIGRVGLLTMAFAIARRTRSTAPRYAEENIMIG
ncbi:potassium transporter [Desulfuromonas acetoxidans]|uniref:K+ transporter Trk n=1 Tax=Desulfuromonas acetoxidans (strain DSM 684 / 11070) TaxID=281689 RepID=Q1K087_DESA6|nr:TrkH family potassium uptake protein [Desulfuromonas acetoxidans]EAT16054.1 K+ transporter Trk [Desulfuromonas acetoxidans DSM 684]MBF0647137.1 potassium transporter [Desulfuromonas acetoxidans]NVD26238.1 potassium transporter [Desulfuromonas acetoxidans]NVE18085.1 potassium transporter [Desulfuromonas acetoxidans]